MNQKSQAYSFLNLSFVQVVLLHLVLFALKIWWLSSWSLELHYEEAQYWMWSTRLDWSYYSKPGMVAWLNWLSAQLFGHTTFAIKFPALVAGFITSIALYCTALDLFKDKAIATLSSVMVYFMPFYYSVTLFHSTDSFLVAFGMISFYFFQKAIRDDKLQQWILVGVFLGLALLTKYSAVIIGVSYFVYLLFYQRKLIPKIILSGVVTILFLLPILIWNIQNDFVTFKHVFNYTDGGGSKNNSINVLKYLNAFAEFAGGQLAMVSPFLVWLLFGKQVRNNKKLVLLSFPALFSFIFFVLILLKSGKAPNVNWPFFIYTPLAIVLSYVLLQKRALKWLIPIALFQAFAFTIISDSRLIDKTPLKSVLKPESDFTEMYHQWEQLADEVTKMEQQYPDAILLTDDYKIASMLHFYKGADYPLYYIGSGSRANQFTYWNDIESVNPKGKEFIFINGNSQLADSILDQFPDRKVLKEIEVKWRGATHSHKYLTLLSGADELKSVTQGF